MRAAIRWLGSYWVDDLAAWRPHSSSWQLGLRIIAGPSGELGEESFDITVCSPAWVAEHVAREGIVDGRHLLIVQQFDWNSIKAYIEGRVGACEGADWTEVANKLARLGYWEFEDYQP